MAIKQLDAKIKILIVEDKAETYQKMEGRLTGHPNFELCHFQNASAVHHCAQNFDLIITDLKLPQDEKNRISEYQTEAYFARLRKLAPNQMIYTASLPGADRNYRPWELLNNCFTVLEASNIGMEQQSDMPVFEIIAKLILQRDFGWEAIFQSETEVGNAFEALVRFILAGLDWIKMTGQEDTFFGKVDFFVEMKERHDPFWERFDFRILVECKNYVRKIVFKDLWQLDYAVIRCDDCSLGFYFAFGDFAKSDKIIKVFQGFKFSGGRTEKRVIPFDQDRIKLLLRTLSSPDKTNLLRRWIAEQEKSYSPSLRGW